jgi:UDP-glucose 4-epimerase
VRALRKVLLTGASGYVGGRLIGHLQSAGWDVHGIVRDPAPTLGIEHTVCDLAFEEANGALAAACEGAESVIHLAGENEVVASAKPAEALASTVTATERVAEACARTEIRRLVYVSTVHVYGARISPGAELTEGMRVEPRAAYAISRLASEHVAAAMSGESYDLVTFRLTNSVGAPAHPAVNRWMLVANDLCREGALTGQLTLRSSGTQWRDFVSLSQVCSALALAADNGERPLPPGTYNLGSGRATTVRTLAELIQDAFERETGERPTLRAPDPEPDPPGPYHVSVERAARHGLRLARPLADAVAETVRFCLEHREELP